MNMYIKTFFSLLFLLFAHTASAATLSLDPISGEYGPGDMFVVTVRLDTPLEECVNAVNVELLYSTDWIKSTAFSKGESLLTLWAEEPVINESEGKITFSGGIPGGYCGRVQGDPGKTNILARLVFNVPGNMIGGRVATGPEPITIRFGSSTQVLLNDGFGTPAPLETQDADLTRIMTSTGIKNEWLDIVHSDDLPPDPFTVIVQNNPGTNNGKYFAVFGTVDKQSGVHHYEIREDDPGKLEFVRGEQKRAVFVTATSPYILTDQTLQSRIVVRAIDNAGNVQEAIAPPTNGDFAHVQPPEGNEKKISITQVFLAGSILVVFFLILGFLYYRRLRNSRAHPVEQEISINHDDMTR